MNPIDTIEKIHKWVPSKYDKFRDVDNLCNILSTTDYSSVVSQFKSRNTFAFADSVMVSGSVCFFGALMMSFCQLGYISNMDNLFLLSSCYMILDNYLDDDTISITDKTKTIQELNIFIIRGSYNTNVVSSNNSKESIVGAICDIYAKMITPSNEVHLKELFLAEVKTMYLQRSPNLNWDDYLHISEWKGGLTCNAIQSIIGLTVTQNEYDLGACIQLVDDMMDLEDDNKMGINTIVTYSYKNNLMDKLFHYIVNKIDTLNKKYNLFKPILYLGLLLSVNLTSDKLKNKLQQFIHFPNKSELMKRYKTKIDI